MTSALKRLIPGLIALQLFSKEIHYNRFEGIWEDCDDRRLFFMSFFLPYNPNIQVFDPEIERECKEYWPNATFKNAPWCDLLWTEDASMLTIEPLQHTSVIYTCTNCINGQHQILRSFLESFGYTLAAHWYIENETGQAVFVKKNIFDAAMRTLNYFPSGAIHSTPSYYPLSDYFHTAPNKSNHHKMRGIDFIYMINLDKRPEKFVQSSNELMLYGICPYRFSGVNGWELPASAFQRIGIRIFTVSDPFFGSTYKNIGGTPFLSNEPVSPNGQAYFSLGMSRGSIGIVLSHLSVLQDAYDSGYETIWVMEDDVEVIEDPQQLSTHIETLDELFPDWDILFTDIDTKDKHNRRIPCRAVAARPNFAIETLNFYLKRFYPLNNDLQGVGMRYGAYSMIVRRSGMKKILDHFKMYGIFLPYDMDYWLIHDLNLFSVTKDIVSTRVGAPTDNHAPGYLTDNQ